MSTWTCPACGREYDSGQIPAEEYAAIRNLQWRYRAVPDGSSPEAYQQIYKSLEAVKTLGALPPQDELLEDTIQIVDQSLNTFVH